jgi:hypothetical protein
MPGKATESQSKSQVATSKPQVSCYLKPGYKKLLKSLALAKNRTVSAQAAYIIEQHIDQLIQEGKLPEINPNDDIEE